MYKEQLIDHLKASQLNYQILGKEVKFKCPSGTHADNNPSFSCNVITGACYCFSCGFSTHLGKILGIKYSEDSIRTSKYLALDRQWELEEEEEQSPILLPPVDFYIHESIRGIPKQLLEDLGVYYCSHGRYRGRLVFPIHDVTGSLVGFDARIYEHPLRPDVTPDVPTAKYLRPTNMRTGNTLYPIKYLRDSDLDISTVILTEGIFDALSYIALGYASVCNFGLIPPSPIKISQLLSIGTTGIINGFDKDLPAIKAWQGTEDKIGIKHEWAKSFKIERPIDIVKNLKEKDINEYLQTIRNV